MANLSSLRRKVQRTSQIYEFKLYSVCLYLIYNFAMSLNTAELIQKDRQKTFVKDIVTKNPVFTLKEVEDFFNLFNLYCDNRRQCDVNDIVSTAKTLSFDKNYRIVFDALVLIAQELDGEWVNFEKFLTLLTQKIGHPNSDQGRRQIFNLCDIEGKQKLAFSDLKKIAQGMKYNLSDDEIQEIINTVSGKGKRDITWDQFNAFLAKKVDKSNSF